MANLGTDGSAGTLTAGASPATVTVVAGASSGATFWVQADSTNTVNFQFNVSGAQEQPAGVVTDYAQVPAGTGIPFVISGASATLTYKSASSTPVAYVSRLRAGVVR
jgi:hypothetical protein